MQPLLIKVFKLVYGRWFIQSDNIVKVTGWRTAIVEKKDGHKYLVTINLL